MPQDVERIWYRDPKGFLRPSRLAEFIPETHTSLAMQLNAAMRFAAYLALMILVFRGTLLPALSIAATVGALTYLLNENHESARENGVEEMSVMQLQRDQFTGQLCTKPVLNNPYMNVLVSDVAEFPERPQACDITDPEVQEQVSELQAHNLYVDADDVYGQSTRVCDRQFYTNPSTTIPNDQTSFARWLYAPAPPGRGTCREGDLDMCASQIFHQRPGLN